MSSLINFLEQNDILHWLFALAGIFSLITVRLMKVKDFSFKRLMEENVIPFIWSVFALSLLVCLWHDYQHSYTHLEAFLTSYCGTHFIFRLHKTPHKTKHYNLKKPHTN